MIQHVKGISLWSMSYIHMFQWLYTRTGGERWQARQWHHSGTHGIPAGQYWRFFSVFFFCTRPSDHHMNSSSVLIMTWHSLSSPALAHSPRHCGYIERCKYRPQWHLSPRCYLQKMAMYCTARKPHSFSLVFVLLLIHKACTVLSVYMWFHVILTECDTSTRTLPVQYLYPAGSVEVYDSLILIQHWTRYENYDFAKEFADTALISLKYVTKYHQEWSLFRDRVWTYSC